MSGVDIISAQIIPPVATPKVVVPVVSPPQSNSAAHTAVVPPTSVQVTQLNNVTNASTPETNLQIIRDDKSGRYVYKFIDSKTGKVTGQFPQEYVLRELAYLREKNGKVLNATV